MRIEDAYTSADIFSLKNKTDLDPLMERVGDARYVLLGEASHGTHEYYTWRTAITKRLILEKGFNFIAVEGDWPDCYRVNRYIKGFDDQTKTPEEVLSGFNRWPTWMWANWEMVALINWLKRYNDTQFGSGKIGFYGLDVYSLWESMDALIEYLHKTDPSAARIANDAMNCFVRYGKDERALARRPLGESCHHEVVQLLMEIRKNAFSYNHDPEASLNATQNSHVLVEAEKYYRTMTRFNNESWNIRDVHMMDTLSRLIGYHGQNSKAIIWEHNTHIGDARFTDMKDDGMVNLGQLVREQLSPENTVLVGFGSYSGTVIAAPAWSAAPEIMKLPEGRSGSLEAILHKEHKDKLLIIFDEEEDDRFSHILPHRAIGVVYNPMREYYNYVPSIINKRYDSFIFINKSTALYPLNIKADPSQIPETFPFEF